MKDKIFKIQNKAKSLRWISTPHSETETLFVVVHKSYPRQNRCFIVSDDFVLSIVGDDHKRAFVIKCGSAEKVIEEVLILLKEWFPAKGGANC